MIGTSVTPVGPGVAVADPDDHREGGGGAGSLQVHPVPELAQVLHPFLDRPLAPELDLDPHPGAGRRLDDGVHFQPGVVPIVIHLGIVGLGVDPKVSHGERLEEEPERFEIGPQAIGAGAKRGNRQRRIDEVPLRRPAQPGAGTKMRGPRWLILDHEDPFQRVQIALNGLPMQQPRASARVGRDDGDRRLGGHVPGQRLQHPPDQHRIAAHTVHAPEVGAADLLRIVADEPLGIARRRVDHARPAAPADERDEIGNRGLTAVRRHRLRTQHGPKGDLAGRVPGLEERHRPHRETRHPARAGVAGGVVGRYGRAGQDETARPAAPVRRAAHMVPDGRRALPFVDEARRWALQYEGRFQLRGAPQTGVHVEENLARRMVPPGGRLPAGSGALDQHRSGRPEPGGELLVDDARSVRLCQVLTPGRSDPAPVRRSVGASMTGILQHIQPAFCNTFNRVFATHSTVTAEHWLAEA